jgi:hypothetical protein
MLPSGRVLLCEMNYTPEHEGVRHEARDRCLVLLMFRHG